MNATELAQPGRSYRTSHGRHAEGMDVIRQPDDEARLAVLIGVAAVAFSVLYLVVYALVNHSLRRAQPEHRSAVSLSVGASG